MPGAAQWMMAAACKNVAGVVVGSQSTGRFVGCLVAPCLERPGAARLDDNQHNQESHGGLPHRQTHFVPNVLRYAPSKALEKP